MSRPHGHPNCRIGGARWLTLSASRFLCIPARKKNTRKACSFCNFIGHSPALTGTRKRLVTLFPKRSQCTWEPEQTTEWTKRTNTLKIPTPNVVCPVCKCKTAVSSYGKHFQVEYRLWKYARIKRELQKKKKKTFQFVNNLERSIRWVVLLFKIGGLYPFLLAGGDDDKNEIVFPRPNGLKPAGLLFRQRNRLFFLFFVQSAVLFFSVHAVCNVD